MLSETQSSFRAGASGGPESHDWQLRVLFVVFGMSLLKAVEIHSQLAFSAVLYLLQDPRTLPFERGILA